MAAKPTIIALEEHYLDPEVKQHGSPGAGPKSSTGSTILAHCA
jgi:hypothetical protein